MNENKYLDDEEYETVSFSEYCGYIGHPETDGDFYYEDEKKNK